MLREQYLERLSAFRDNTDFLKIVTGVRRCGKSVLMEQFRDILRSDRVPEDRIFSFNLEMPEYSTIRNGDSLAETVLPKIPETGRCYVFFDEI